MAYTTGIIYLLLAVATDVIANIFLKKSNGFHNKKYGFASLGPYRRRLPVSGTGPFNA